MPYKQCCACKVRLPISSFYYDKHAKDGFQSNCKKCALAYRNAQNREHKVAGIMTHSQRSRQRLREEVLTHYARGVPACNCCGEAHIEFLSIDHIDGGGRQHRKKIGDSGLYTWLKRHKFPAGFRVLCHNCNQSLGAHGYCPHKTARPLLPVARVCWSRDDAQKAIEVALETFCKKGDKPTIRKVAKLSSVPTRMVGYIRRQLVATGKWQ